MYGHPGMVKEWAAIMKPRKARQSLRAVLVALRVPVEQQEALLRLVAHLGAF